MHSDGRSQAVANRPLVAIRGIYQTKGDLAPLKLWPNDIFAGTFLYPLRHGKRKGARPRRYTVMD